jgi:hypothetical protein
VPVNGLALPASQSMHAAIPCVEYEPGVQSMQTTSDGACVPVRDDALPAGHLSQALWPPAEYVPASQFWQRASSSDPAAATYLPATQGAHAAPLRPKRPGWQAAQTVACVPACASADVL